MSSPRQLLQVAQHVEDLDRAVGFYRDVLGLQLLGRFDPPGMAFFQIGEVRILLEAAAPSAVLYLEADDIEAEHRRLEAAGVTFQRGPHLVFHHDGTFAPDGLEEWMALFHDSEGNQLAIMERRQT